MSVRPLRDGDVDRLAVALARAFHDDPVTRWVYASRPAAAALGDAVLRAGSCGG